MNTQHMQYITVSGQAVVGYPCHHGCGAHGGPRLQSIHADRHSFCCLIPLSAYSQAAQDSMHVPRVYEGREGPLSCLMISISRENGLAYVLDSRTVYVRFEYMSRSRMSAKNVPARLLPRFDENGCLYRQYCGWAGSRLVG